MNFQQKLIKKLLTISILTIFSIVCIFSLSACKNDDGNNAINIPQVEDDSNYQIEIIGITPESIIITKQQIIDLPKKVIYNEENPAYASDKTDENGNLIPHSLIGVYLDDVLNVYADGAVSGAYSAMVLKASDGYETVLTQETYSTEHGGSKMILAYEYDGIRLNPNESSGAIRAIFPDQIANSWTKKLTSIEFGDASLVPPSPDTLSFVELLGNSFQASFSKTETVGANTYDFTYYGISMKKLFEANILNAEETDKMYLIAWDYITNGETGIYREYTNWKRYEYYQNAFLADSYKIGENEIEILPNSPTFDGENIQHGMCVKNTLAFSVKNTALVNLKMSFERYDNNNDNIIDFSDILLLVNMLDNSISYTITDKNNSTTIINGSEIENATLENNNGVFVLHYGENLIEIKSISKNINI